MRKVDQFDDEWRFGFVVVVIIIIVVLLIVTLDISPIIFNPIPNLLHLRILLRIYLNPFLRARPVRFVDNQQTAPDHPKLEVGICFSDQRDFLAEGTEDGDEGVSRETAGRRRRRCRRIVSLVVGGGRVRVRVRRDREEFGDAFAQLVRFDGFAVGFDGVDGLRGDVIVDLKELDLRVRSCSSRVADETRTE